MTGPGPARAATPAFSRNAAARERQIAQSTVWLSGMRILVPATALTLMVSQTQYFTANPVADAIRWTLLGTLCVMFLLRPRGTVKLRHPGLVDWFIGVFMTMALASFLYSGTPSLTLQRAISTLLLYGAAFWTIWFYADMVRGERIARSLLAMTTLMFIAGLVAYAVTEDTLMAGRFRGVFANPNAVGMLGILFLPVAVANLVRSRKASALLVVLLMAASVIFSGSRNGVLAASLALLLMLLRVRAWRAFTLLAVAATVIYLVMPEVSDTVGTAPKGLARLMSGDRIATGGGRVEAWQAAIPIIRQKVAFGYGFGTEELIFQGMTFRIHRGAYVHNSYLGLAYQLGLVGAVLFFLPLAGFLIRRMFKRGAIPVQTAAYEAVLLGGLIACLFESWIYSAGNAFAFPFWIFIMLLVRAHYGAEDPDQVPRRPARARMVPPLYTLAKTPLPPRAEPKVPARFDPPSVSSR